MGILASIRRSFEGRAPERPHFAVADQEAGEKDVGRSHDPGVAQEYTDHELSGMTIGIEHVDADGSVSRRWATIVATAEVDGHNRLLCHCFRSEGLRSFRMDRVINLFDEHGETFDVREFLHLKASPTKARTGGGSYRSAIRDGLRVLIAVARADGYLDAKEVDVIMDYARAEGARKGVTEDEAALGELRSYVERLQPSGSVVASCIDRLTEEGEETQKNLLAYLENVIKADGVIDGSEAELEMLIAKRLERGGDVNRPH
jgi:tellurite resistance protein